MDLTTAVVVCASAQAAGAGRWITVVVRPDMTPRQLRRFAVTLAAGVAGLAINLMPLGIASLIWPGRIVALPVAIILGPWFGVIAALIAAAPYAETPLMVSVLVIEAVLVGIAARRGKSVILAGAIAWTIAAVTLLPITAFVLDDYIRRGDALQDDMAPVAVTTRERELLQLVAEGQSNKEAAATLGISVKTIAAHRANIMRKLHLRSVSDLVRYAIRNKIVQP